MIISTIQDEPIQPVALSSKFSNDPEIAGVTGVSIKIMDLPNHGAPCGFKVSCGGKTDKNKFFDKMAKINDALNMTPDDYPKNPSEMSYAEKNSYSSSENLEGNEFGYPNYRGVHVLAGGECAYIDRISAKNARIVSRKILRLLHEEKLITTDQLQQAYKDMGLTSRQPASVGRVTSPR